MKKKILGLLLAFTMVISAFPLYTGASDGNITIINSDDEVVEKTTTNVEPTPQSEGTDETSDAPEAIEPQNSDPVAKEGNDFTGYTRGDAIWGEVWGNASESFVIKVLDANGNVMGTTSLNNVDGIIDGDVNVTWTLLLDAASNTDKYWTMEWTTAPTIDNMPAKVELWVDGVKVSGGDVVLNGPDEINKIYAAVTDASGKILSYHTDVQEAIKAAAAVTSVAKTATAGTVEILRDVTVDKWIMFAEKMTISDGSLITLNINGVTIDGNGKALTIKSIESAGNGGYLFYDAQNLTVKDLTINIADGLVGGIGLQSGTISNVTFNGGQYGVLPGKDGVTIDGCTFNDTKGYAIYFENARPGIVVNDNTFNTASGAYAITMRDNEQFTNNTINTGKVNLANSAKSTVSGNDFGTERFKVYNAATAKISNNTINNLVFNETTIPAGSTFTNNTLSTEAQAAFDAMPKLAAQIVDVQYATLQAAIDVAQAGETIVLLRDVTEEIQIANGATVVIDLNGHTLNGAIKPCTPASLTIKNGTIDNDNASYSAIEINAGALVLENVNVTSVRHGVRIDGAVTATINGGTYKADATSGTRHSVNVSGAAEVTIKAGTFIGPKGTTMDSGSAVCVQAGAKVTIEGGDFSKGKNSTLGVSGTLTVYGGTFDQDPIDYLADGYAVKAENGTYTVGKAVAKIGDKSYITLEDALKALVDGATLKLLEDITISETWDCRTNGAKITASNVMINGNGKTLKLTGAVDDKNWNTVFRVEGNEVWFHNLTIDVSEATGVQRGISAKLNLAVTECIFIGNDTAKRAIIYGEGAGAAISNVEVNVVGSTFVKWTYGVSDNQNAQDAKYVNIDGNTFTNAHVLVSAHTKLEFTNNEMFGGYVNISSYSVPNKLIVTALGSTVDDAFDDDNKIVAAKINNAYDFQTPVAEVGGKYYMTLEEAFVNAQEGDTIKLLADAAPALTSQKAITKAAVIDLGGKTLTLTEDDLYFGTTEFKNGTIVVDPSVKPSTAVFWMFANQTLTFDGVKIVATGVTGTYLIGLDGNNADLNLLNGSEIVVENTTALDLDIVCVNASTGNDIVIKDSKINVTNLDGRVLFRGNYTIGGTSVLNLQGITKAGIRIEAGQTLSIEDTASVTIDGDLRDGGIHLTDLSATYTKADTATVNAVVNKPVAVAMIGTTEYATLQAAINAVQNGETITLLADCAETITFTQTKDLSFVLDGNDKTMTGSINITARAGKGAESTLVIKNFKFTTDKTSHDFIKSVETNYYPNNITIQNCSFTGTGDINTTGYAVVAVRLKSANNILIKDCTGTGLHSFLQNTAGWDLAVDNVDITNSLSGFAMGTVQGVTVKNCDIEAVTSGIRLDAQYNNNAVIADNNITAFIPVVVRKASVDGTITFNGTNNMTAKNTDGLWCAIGTDEYKENGNLPSAPTAKITVTLNDTGLDAKGVYGEYDPNVAYIGEQGYETLAAAVDAAKSGDTIILKNGEYDLPLFSGKELTFKGETRDGVIINDAPAAVTQGWLGSTFHFENLTAKGATTNYHGLANGVVAVTYKDCNINGLRFLYTPVTFENCAFNAEGVEHSFWTYGSSSVTVKNCTFTYTDRAVNCYSENGANHEVDIVFTDCTFTYAGTAATPEGAVEINSGSVKSIDLTMNGCTAPANGEMWFNSQWDSKKGQNTIVTVDNEVVWKPLKGSGTKEDPILINDLADLILFRDTVNTYTQDGSNQFKGKYVKLTADIDLAGINWTPIGTNSVGDHAAFLGIFDGDGHTIYNLYINADGGHLGFFARVGSYAEGITPTVKNIKFHNVDISTKVTDHWTTGHGDYVGGVIANAGGNSVVSDITVTGDVYIVGCAYVGGIVGHGYPDINNCVVNANDGSYIHSGYWCAGGIIGYAGEGGTPITNSSVAGVDIWSAYGAAAAVAGLLQDGNKLENVSASDVKITSNSDYCMGYIAGNGEASTITNVTMQNVTATAKDKPITSTDAVASVNGTIYFDLQSAINAGGEVKLLRNVTLTETLTIPAGKTITLDLNGKTLSQSKACTASYSMIENKGNLTITGNGKISFTDTGAGDSSFGWGSYTIRNEGTLVVENGTIEHLGAQAFATHCIQAIFNYSGSTTIKDGTISTPNYRSIRLWNGSLTIEGGEIDGQVWIQTQKGTGATLTVTGGSFSPNGRDASSIYITNDNNKVTAAISGGEFDTKIGAYDAAALNGPITGGTFTEAAVNGTNAALLGKNVKFQKNTDGTYAVIEKHHLTIIVSPVATMSTESITVATMDDAVAYALANPHDSVVYQITGPVVLTTGGSHGIIELGTNVTIEGVTDEAKLTIVGGGVPDFKGVTFKNITLADEGTYLPTANEFMYQNYIDCTFENVTFEEGIRVSGNTTITDCTINSSKNDQYALWSDGGKVTMTGTTVNVDGEGYGMVKSDNATEYVLTNNTFEYLNTANKEALNTKGATINASNNTFIGCTEGIIPTDKTNYAADGTTVLTNEAIAAGNEVFSYVAVVDGTKYPTLAEAIAAAKDGETITLIWVEGAAPIAMNGAVYGKTVTITGTATVDWSKGFLFVGRGGVGNGTVIFDGANLTSASNSSSYGIHVSGREKDTDNKYDGTLIIKNSTIELDYLINRGAIEVDNSTLTVKNGFGIAGRPASETENGEAATATITIKNGSYVKVLNHNGMGIGVASSAKEGYGILNLIDSTFECENFNVDSELGDFNVSGTSTVKVNTLAGKRIDVEADTTLKDSMIGGSINMLGNLTIDGGLTLTGGLWASNGGTLSGDTLTASYFMFQTGTYTINADIEAVYGYLSFGGTFEVNSKIHTTGTNGEVLYINGNVTLNDGAVLDSDNSVFLCNDNAVLTINSGAKIDSNLKITKAGAKLKLNVTGMTAGDFNAITGTVTNSGNGTIEVVGDNQLYAEVVDGKIVLKQYVAMIGDTYYKTIADAIAAANAGDTIKVLAGTYALPAMKAGITIEGAVNADGTPAVLFEGTLGGTLENLTMKNIHIKGANAQRWAYAKGDLVFENVIFEATSVYALHFDGIEEGTTLLYKDCTIIGWAAMGGSPASCKFDGCTIKDNGSYGVIRTYFDATIENCTFDIANANTTDVYEDGIHAVSGAEVTVNNCTNVNGDMKDIVNISGTSVVIVDGVEIKHVAKIGDDYYETLTDAFKAATNGCTIEILADVVIDYKWDCRDYATNGSHSQFKESVTINGNGHTIEFTGTINDNNWNTVFRFEENATVNNLTIDISKATGAQRVISAKKSLTVDGLKIVGNAKYGIIFGEGAGATDLAATEIVIKNSTLTGTRRAVSDNEGGKDVKSVTITGNTLNANVYVSASDSISFNNNTATGEVDLRSYATDNVLTVEAQGNTLAEGKKNYIYAKTIDAQNEFTNKYVVSTKAELNAAIGAAKEGDTILLIADIDYGTDQLKIEKAITLDLGGKTLTTRNAYGGMSLKNGPSIKNGTIVHASNTAAIKVWNAVAFEDLVIDVQGKGDANKTIGGIVLQSGSTTRVDSIKNVTIKGDALTNGIETYNCGDATQDVIGSMENVTINAKGTGMLISAPCGTATNCTISGDVNAIEIWIKGNYSASLELVNSEVEGGVFAHDEFSSNPNIENNGTLNFTVDEDTTGVDDVTVTIARAENVEGLIKDVIDNAQAKVNDTYYATLEAAFAAAQNGDTITLLADVAISETIKVNANIILDLNGKTITGTDNATSSFALIEIQPGKELTVNDAVGTGKITLTATNDRDWNAYSSVISNQRGKLIVNGGTIEHLGGTDMAYGIDNLTNGKGTYAETVINGGTIKSTYRAIRQFLNGVEAQNILTINGGTIEGANKSVWMQDPSKNANSGTLTIGENAILKGDVYLYVTPESTTWPVNVSISKSALNGESTVITGNVPAGYELVETNGTFGVKNGVAKIGNEFYSTLEAAFAAANAGDEVEILVAGTYALTTSGKNIIITGAVDGVVFDNIGAKNMGGANVTFNKVTFDYYPNVNYTGLQHSGNLVYNNCTFNGQVFLYGVSETFNNCTFNQNSADAYNVWTYGAKEVAFNECTFNSVGKAVLVYNEGASHFIDLNVVDTDFIATAPVDGKAAIEIDTSLTEGANITIDDATTATGFSSGNVSGNSLWNNKKGSNTDANNDITVTVGDETVLVPVTFVAKIGEVGYTSIADAIKAAQAGETVTILAGNYTTDISVNKAITVVGETDDQGNNLVNITGRVSVSTGATVKNLNVHNEKTGTYDCALSVNGKDIVIDGVKLTGYNGMRYCYAKGDITIKNSTINGSYFAVHFDGSDGGNLTIENCDITGWVSYGGGIDKVTLKNSTFDAGSYAGQRSYAENLVIEGSTFEAGYKLDINVTGSNVTVTDTKMSDGSSVVDLFNKDDLCGQNEVKIDGESIAYVAKIGNIYYATLEEALANVADWTTIKLVANATLGYNARDEFGRDTTTDIIIDGQGYTLTLNQKNSDWASIGMKNADGKLTLKNMTIEKTGYGDTSGAWNTHAIIFKCNVEMTDVTVNNGIAVQNGATLNNVTINEANGYYGLWINGNGQTVTMNGGAINATNGGRGIKIADQYVDAPASVTLTVDGTKFNTAKKAAVLVSSTAGADITATNVDITNVASDSTNFVHVDEDWAEHYGEVTVTGATKAQEAVENFVATLSDGTSVKSYYKTIADAIKAAQAGDTVTILAGDYTGDINVNKAITVVGETDDQGNNLVNITGKLNITADGATVKNLNVNNGSSTAGCISAKDVLVEGCTVVGGNGFRYCYTKGTVTFKDSTITGATYGIHFDGSAGGNIVIDNCVITGWTSFAGTIEKVSIKDTEFAEGNYNYIRFYQDAEISGCTFNEKMSVDVANSVSATVTVTNSTVTNGSVEDLFEGYDMVNSDITVDGENLVRVAKIGNVYYETIADAIKAAQAGETVTILAGDYTGDINVNKAITVVGETDDQGNNLVNITGKLNITADGATVKNLNVNNGSSTAGCISAKDVLVEGCTVVGGNGFRYCYTKGTVTFKDSTITGATYGIHFDGSAGGNIVIDNCVITGWTSFAGTIEKVTIKNTEFADGNYDQLRFYQDAELTNVKFNPNMTIDFGKENVSASFTGCSVTDGSSLSSVIYLPDLSDMGIKVTVDDKQVVAVIGEEVYFSLAEAIAAVGAGDVVIELVTDATFDYNARDAYGVAGTTSLTINGNGHTLTLNQKNSDWASIGLANANAKLVLNDMTIEKTGYGDTSGAWNTHAIIFSCNVEMTDVTVNNGIAVQNGATLNNVTINEANGYYGLWINGNGQTVTMTGGSITATNGGRGIKIADQYVDAPASVTLTVEGTKFTTAKKAAVLVSSTAGANITASNVDITNVAEDSVNFVWIDEDWAGYYGNVTVTGGTVAQEAADDFVVEITDDNNNVLGYYKTLADAIAAAEDGETVVLLQDIDLAKETLNTLDGQYDTYFLVEGKSITVDLNGKTISGAYTGTNTMLVGVFSTDNNGHLTLTGNGTVDVTATNTVYGLIVNYEEGCSITIENGTYRLDAAKDSLIYTGANGEVTVNGGNFHLGNVGMGPDGNGSPWIFNAGGKNTTHITVNGGTFNADVNHQFWAHEVELPKEKALKDNGDGTWTVVDAVAWGVENNHNYDREVGYATLTDAIDHVESGSTITLLKNFDLDGSTTVTTNNFGYETLLQINGKDITIDFNGYTVSVTPSAPNANGGLSGTIESVIFVENSASLTLKDSVGNGGFRVNKGTALYTLIYNCGSTLTIDGGSYWIEELTAKGSIIYAEDENGKHVTTVNGGNFHACNVGSSDDTKPWIFNTEGKNESFVIVNGGTFNQNILINLGSQKDCEVTIPETHHIYSYADGWRVEEHAYDESTVTAPTCTDKGYTTHVCKCGHSYDDTYVDELGHEEVAIGTEIDSTCTSIGITAGKKCSVCGVILEAQAVIPVKAHTEETIPAVDPTFNSVGYTEGKKCSVCGNILTAPTEVPALVGVAQNTTTGVIYGTLAEAIAAAKAGETIALLGNVTEDVTIDKSLTIDGANFTYTGGIGVSGSTSDVTIKNVNFVNYTENYAITTNRIKSITVENCTLNGYDGFLYANKSTPTVVVKNVTMDGGIYGIHWVYGTTATLENVKMTNVTYGLYIQNYASKTINVKNCDITSIAIWERSGYSGVQTFKFEGNNTVGTLSASQYAKYVLAAADATLAAPEGATVTTNIEGCVVKYKDGKYFVFGALVKNETTGKIYGTLAEAIAAANAGDTIVLLGNVTEDVTIDKSLTIDGANFTYTGGIGVSGSTSDVTIKNVNFVNYTENYAITTNRIKSITVENCTLNGYDGFLYANKSTPTVVVKNVTMNGGIYGIHWVYGTTATLENVKMTNVTNGLLIQNYASKTINVKNCDITSIEIWERSGSSGVQTFKFEGNNTVGTLSASQYAKYVLAEVNATLTAPEGATVTTTVEGCYVVDYAEDVYKLVVKHTYGTTVTAPTCTERGYTTYVCSACGDTYVDNYVDALGHTTVIDGAVAPTCTETGLTTGAHCSVCDTVLVPQTDIDALGHTEEIIPAVAPTFDSVGFTEGKKCSVCGIVTVEPTEIPMRTDPAVQIGTTQYATLEEALAAAKDGDTIVLLRDTTVSSITVGSLGAIKLTIDLGGHTITSGSTVSSFKSGTVLTLKNGTITSNTTGGTLKATYGGVLVLGDGLTVKSGPQANAIVVDNGTLKVEDGATVEVEGGIDVIQTSAATNKVTITGGTFKGNMNIHANTDISITGGTFTVDVNEYCAEGYVAIANADGTWTVSEDAVAKIGDKQYASLADALNAAVAGDTVVLLKDYNESFVMVTKGITLDLNGKKLTANYLVAFAGNHVIDSSADKAGRLVISAGNLSLSTANAQLPVLTNDGYAFAAVNKHQSQFTTTETGFNVVYKPTFGKDFNAIIAGLDDVGGLEFVIKLSWDDNGIARSQEFKFSDEQAQTVYGGKTFVLAVADATGFGSINVTGIVRSDLGVIASCNIGTFPPASSAAAETN